MHIRGVIHLHEGFQRNLEALAVLQHPEVVVRNAPRTGIQIQSRSELYLLREAAQLGVGVAAIQRPAAAAGAVVVFENLNLIAGVAQLECGRHAGHARAQDQYRGAFRIALQVDAPGVTRLACKSKFRHCLVHDGAAGKRSDQLEERAPIHGCNRGISHGRPFLYIRSLLISSLTAVQNVNVALA